MTRRSHAPDDRAADRRKGDRKDRPVRGTSATSKPSKEMRKALRKEAEAERRLIDREQLAADKVERARQRLSEAVEKLAKAQARVSRRADRLSEAEVELRLRQRERAQGPHRSGMVGSYDDPTGEAPAQGAAADLGLLDADDADAEPAQGAAIDAGLLGSDGVVDPDGPSAGK